MEAAGSGVLPPQLIPILNAIVFAKPFERSPGLNINMNKITYLGHAQRLEGRHLFGLENVSQTLRTQGGDTWLTLEENEL